MKPAPEYRESPLVLTASDVGQVVETTPNLAEPRRPSWSGTVARSTPAWQQLRWTLAVYAGSRALLLILAVVDSALTQRSLGSELSNWDGYWYIQLASNGYPTHIPHVYSTLGFFPLYSMVMWLVAHVLFCSYLVAGLLISGIGGFVATVLVQRLCTSWWGERNGRRAVLFFCAFPGSVVFSLVYSEGILIPLAAGCLIALERRRWLLAGILAGLATAVGPDAIAVVVACAVASLLELRRRGWRDREAQRSLLAPLLSPVGLCAFAVFLWVWDGTPLACFKAQSYAWGERSDPLALYHQAKTLAGEISFSHFDYHAIDLNLVAGLLGAVVLVIGIALMLRSAHRPPAAAIAWALGIGFLAVTSEYTPPNPRLLITAFPALLVIVCYLKQRGFKWLIAVSTTLLVVMSAITYVGFALRP
ncbi:MAG: mannosyltransferase family protein [Acidimicrobiales bacterium]